ncbi:helix-turn-helix domain-containing protein [soil metagenome]
MTIEIITKEDLQLFRKELLQDLRQLLESQSTKPARQWLKSREVRKMLKISPGTLQNLRINGTIRYSRMGRIIFYNAEDIEKVLEENIQEA